MNNPRLYIRNLLRLTAAMFIGWSTQAICQSQNPPPSQWAIKKIAVDVSRPNLMGGFLPAGEIFVLDAGVPKPRKVADGQSPVFSPDGSKIVYCTRAGTGFGQLRVINSDGTGRTQLGNTKGEACPSDWSADGKRILLPVQTNKGWMIATVTFPSGDLQLIASGVGRARWSPDGKRFVFYREPSGRKGKQAIWISNADGSDERKVIDDNSVVSEADWSPDGNSIVFASKRDHDHHSAIYQVNVDGTGLQKIASNDQTGLYFPVFCPDGGHLIVDAAGESSGLHIVLLDLSTQQGKILTYGGHPSVIWEKK